MIILLAKAGLRAKTGYRMPSVKLLNDSDSDDLDQEIAESDMSGNEDIESTSGSDLDPDSDDGSSDKDDEVSDKELLEYFARMAELEKQFLHVKEQLYEERKSQLDLRLEGVKLGTAVEYTQPLEELNQTLKNNLEVAETLCDLKVVSIKHAYEAEQQASLQNFESEKALLRDSIKCDIEEKIKRLEEDRKNIDSTSDLWNKRFNQRKKKRKTDSLYLGKQKKPVPVSGPYIVYMLDENDILDDWTTIGQTLKDSKQNSEYKINETGVQISTRFTDGKLLFEGDLFHKGELVYIDVKNKSSWAARVISLNTNNVLLQKQDGSWCTILICDLQRGKYNIRRAVN